jgi:hypothetical protein
VTWSGSTGPAPLPAGVNSSHGASLFHFTSNQNVLVTYTWLTDVNARVLKHNGQNTSWKHNRGRGIKNPHRSDGQRT